MRLKLVFVFDSFPRVPIVNTSVIFDGVKYKANILRDVFVDESDKPFRYAHSDDILSESVWEFVKLDEDQTRKILEMRGYHIPGHFKWIVQ
jgi:hypothetical protein